MITGTKAASWNAITNARTADFCDFQEWLSASAAALVAKTIAARCLMVSRTLAETVSERLLRKIGFGRSGISTTLERLDGGRARARPDWPN